MKNKFLIFGYRFEYKTRKKIKIDTQIHTQKLKICFLYFKLSYSQFSRDLQNTQTQILKKLKTQTQT